MLCATVGKCTCTIYEQKHPVCIKILRAYTGIGDAETPSAGMLRKPGDLPYPCLRQKSLKSLPRATHCTDRAQTSGNGPNGRIVPTPPNVSDKGASTKRCVRRKKKNDSYTYTYSMIFRSMLVEEPRPPETSRPKSATAVVGTPI